MTTGRIDDSLVGYSHCLTRGELVHSDGIESAYVSFFLSLSRNRPALANPYFNSRGLLRLDCPRSGPGPVRVRTQTQVLQCNYFKKLFVINIHIYIVTQKVIFLICALPNSLRPNFQLIFWNYESVNLLTFMLPSK